MPKKENTVLWWVGWIVLTIASFFVAVWFWTPIVARHYGDMHTPGAPGVWITAVFGSWMVLLVPLIVIMYAKVDKAYEDARINREKKQLQEVKKRFKVRAISIEGSRRRIGPALSRKLKRIPETIKHGHLVTAVLRDGRRVPNVFVKGRTEILGVYGVDEMPFSTGELSDLEPVSLHEIPDFRPEKWLRLDGIGTE